MTKIEIISTGDGSHSLIHTELNETFHSKHGAIRESLHVFIEAGLKYWVGKNPGKPLSILEVGFGTGLNTLLTLHSPHRPEKTTFTTLEAFPVSKELIRQLNYPNHMQSPQLGDVFNTIHDCAWDTANEIVPGFILEKKLGRVQDIHLQDESFDLIYFDAFAPNKQPEMWDTEILRKMRDCMKQGAVFVTYCAKGQLKRDLRALGIAVEALEGPPGKREMVRGLKS